MRQGSTLPVLKLLSLPIGNLGDITQRALENLAQAQWVLAEDTRNFKKVCDLLNIDTSTKTIESFHDHSTEKCEKIIEKINSGRDAILVSDAGSPIISDPAYPLVIQAMKNGIKIESVPGVSSVIVALELSGLPPHPFSFHGFLPRDKKGREYVFNDCHQINHTHIFFESPHRIQETLDQLCNSGLKFDIAVARELTKKFEEVVRFNSGEWEDFREKLNPRGEVVLLMRPLEQNTQEALPRDIQKLAQEVLDKKAHPKAVSKLLAKILDRNTKDIYAEISR